MSSFTCSARASPLHSLLGLSCDQDCSVVGVLCSVPLAIDCRSRDGHTFVPFLGSQTRYLLCLFFLSSYGDVYPRILSARHGLLITIIICSIICSLCMSCDNVAPNALNIDSNRAHLPDYSLLSRLGLSCDQHCSVVDVPCFVPLATDYRSPVPSILSFLPVNTVRLDDWMIGRAALVALLTDLG